MDKKFDYYKEQYFFELERKNQLTSNLSIPIGFLTAIFTASAYFALNIQELINHWSFWIFIGLFLIAIYFIFRASRFLFKAFKGLAYSYNPSTKEIYNYELKHKGDNDLDDKFFNGIKQSYINSASINRLNNNTRSIYLFKTNENTILAIIFIIISAISFFIGKNLNDYNNNKQSFTKNQIIMTEENENGKLSSENEDLPSDPDTSDFPTDELIIENLEIDIPTETRDIPEVPPETESSQESD
jgi:hypothetical protein